MAAAGGEATGLEFVPVRELVKKFRVITALIEAP